jgi:hypothetical protein
MMKRLITFVFVLVFCLTSLVYAGYDIIMISDCNPPDVPDGNHEDDALVSWLQSLGYTVDTGGMGQAYREGENPFDDPTKVAALESAGMVLVSRRTDSGSYDNDRKSWNELENPLLLCSGYLTRGETSSTRWGWTSGGSGDADLEITGVDVVGLHPFIPASGGLFDWSEAPTPGQAPKGVYLPDSTEEVVAGSIIVATFDNRPILIDIPAGADFDAVNNTTDKYGIAGDRRGFLGSWGYDTDLNYRQGDSRNRRANWGDFITDDYKALMERTIAEMIPEPATVALLGLGGLFLIRKRY